MPGECCQMHVFDRVAERPVANVVQECSSQKGRGVVGRDVLRECLISSQSVNKRDCQTKHTERVFKATVDRTWVDECYQAKLSYVGKPPHLGGVDCCL